MAKIRPTYENENLVENAICQLIINASELPEVSCWRTASGRRHHHVYNRLYLRLFGPIPEGLELHHICEEPACCNPWHLEPLTRKEHARISPDHAKHHREKTHCPRGHAYAGTNLKILADGGRCCRACQKIRNDSRPRAKERTPV